MLVCWGPDSWRERSPDKGAEPERGAEPEKAGGLKMRTDADSRLLSSSAFWEGDGTQVRRRRRRTLDDVVGDDIIGNAISGDDRIDDIISDDII